MIGKIYEMSTSFKDYSYIIMGEGGIGKTTLAHELGKIATGSNKGTLVLTVGAENVPTHIDGLYGEVVPDFPTLMKYSKELAKNRMTDYSETHFICIDSMDEYYRIDDNYVVAEYNASIQGAKDKRPVKSISGAYGGYRNGEARSVDLAIKIIEILKKAGYQVLLIGHTKIKSEKDPMTGVVYDKLTCNINAQYYNALKDKVNLVVNCYNEKEIVDIKEEKNAFSKKMQNKGKLVGTKRVMIFRDNDNAVDTKTHFPHIVNKIDFSAEGFVKAVEDALIKKKRGDKVEIQPYFRPETKDEEDDEIVDNTDDFEEIEEGTIEIIDEVEQVNQPVKEEAKEAEIADINKLRKEISTNFKTADKERQAKAKLILKEKGLTLANADEDTLNEIASILLD